ncbi:MAG: VCBS repeat-containing protein [Saprospiraceae bacterium]|nr:VCBS repeat-containing protein [Saprospiraceae bacterium]
MSISVIRFLVLIFLFVGFCSCKKTEKPLFELLDNTSTGIDFSNDLTVDLDINIFNYLYFYNGGGVGAGDFNNDGLIDLFFTANQKDNKLYINKGNLKFDDVSTNARIINDGGWSTGVSVVDINNDGLLDIFVSQVGDLLNIKGRNQFFVCTGILEDGTPVYEDKAREMGLDSTGLSTQAVFFDYDMDGDLDMFQLNHSTHKNNTFGQRKSFEGTTHELSGDRLYRNDEGKFVDVSEGSGINRSSIGYGLGVVVSDINMDGLPDLYIGNDFHENDYYYINNGDGTFSDKLTEQMMHTSRFSMGVDAADINNDGYPDVISLDMLPEDPFILKKSEGEDALDIFNFKLGYGYNHQYAKNALQINNRNGTFSDVATYAGVHATDWSWAALLADFDNDGFKDIFVSNGIPKRMNDIDYINFMVQSEVQWKIRTENMEKADLDLIHKLPEIKLYNKFYRNQGALNFEDLEGVIKNNKLSYSNGAIAVDLDNDGDLDIVTNNIDEKAFVYENKSCNRTICDNRGLTINLIGPEKNINAVSAKLLIFLDNEIRSYEKQGVRGFLSSAETPLVIAASGLEKADSIVLVWPDNTYEKISLNSDMTTYRFEYKKGLPLFDFKSLIPEKKITVSLTDLSEKIQCTFVHQENPFVEFNREILIPHAVSNEGPAIAVGDVNGDGLEDIYFGNAKWKESELWFQNADGTFYRSKQEAISLDSTYEDVDAVFIDVDNDGDLDLLVASGGNEYSNNSEYLLSRLYLNDGKGSFTTAKGAFKDIYSTASCILPFDFNNDGFVDLFLGSRAVPWKYGEIPKSYFLQNNGKGQFTDVTDQINAEKGMLGFVTDGKWADMDGDGLSDLVVSLEWDAVSVLYNKGGKFEKKAIGSEKGWWNFIELADLDNDGDLDIIAGNLGLNSRLKASTKEPVSMYYADFDKNDTKEQVLTYYVKGKEIPFANLMELTKQIPPLKKKFLKAEDFAKADLMDIFPKDILSKADKFTANHFETSIYLNDGKGNFTRQTLPIKAQLSSFKSAVVRDINGDKLPDIILGGNFYENNVQMGRYDADYGCVLLNKGNGTFEYTPHNGIQIKGQVRTIRSVSIQKNEYLIFGRNNEKPLFIEVFHKSD